MMQKARRDVEWVDMAIFIVFGPVSVLAGGQAFSAGWTTAVVKRSLPKTQQGGADSCGKSTPHIGLGVLGELGTCWCNARPQSADCSQTVLPYCSLSAGGCVLNMFFYRTNGCAKTHGSLWKGFWICAARLAAM